MKTIKVIIGSISGVILCAGVIAGVYFLTKSYLKHRSLTPVLTNEQVIEETKFCEDAGLDVAYNYRGDYWHRNIIAVKCYRNSYNNSDGSKIKKSNITEVNVNLNEE